MVYGAVGKCVGKVIGKFVERAFSFHNFSMAYQYTYQCGI